MNDTEIAELKAAVERAHRCPATYRASERVREQNQQFEVALFDILGHPRALLCYAWFSNGGSPASPRSLHSIAGGTDPYLGGRGAVRAGRHRLLT